MSSARDQLCSPVFSKAWREKISLVQCLLLGCLPCPSLVPVLPQGPALCPLHLDVLLGDEPRPMCQQLVDLTELAQLLGGTMESKQPLSVTATLHKLSHVGTHQVGTLVAGSSLWRW